MEGGTIMRRSRKTADYATARKKRNLDRTRDERRTDVANERTNVRTGGACVTLCECVSALMFMHMHNQYTNANRAHTRRGVPEGTCLSRLAN